MPEHRHIRAEHKCRQTDGGRHIFEHDVPAQQGVEPREQEHAGFHHRGGVQIRRHGRGRSHRRWQPEVKRKLRRFGERTQKDQRKRNVEMRMTSDCLPRREPGGKFKGPRDIADEQNPGEQGESAAACDGEGHACTLSGQGAVGPETNQQEGGQTRQLPKHHEQQHVFGEDDAQHRGHEEHKQRIQPADSVLRSQVIARIEYDEQPDAEDEERE